MFWLDKDDDHFYPVETSKSRIYLRNYSELRETTFSLIHFLPPALLAMISGIPKASL